MIIIIITPILTVLVLSENPHYIVVPYRSEERTKGEMRRVHHKK